MGSLIANMSTVYIVYFANALNIWIQYMIRFVRKLIYYELLLKINK